MDFYDRAAALAEAAAKDISETTRTLAKAVTPEKVKFGIETLIQAVPHFLDHYYPGTSEMIRSVEDAISEDIKRVIDISVNAVMGHSQPGKTAPEQSDRADGSKSAPDEPAKTGPEAKAGPEVGANEKTGEEQAVRPEDAKVSEQETAELKARFEAEQKELVRKLDAMADKYFENHPGLPQDQRTDAEGTFKKIKDDAVEALKAQQDTRLLEQQTRQQESRDNSEQKRRELDGRT